jgi:hypothetical protein
MDLSEGRVKILLTLITVLILLFNKLKKEVCKENYDKNCENVSYLVIRFSHFVFV